jgi:WD40 repeat protein
MALFDLPAAGHGPEFSRLHYALDFDGELVRYARSDRTGQITIHRVEDDSEICRIPQAVPEALLLMSPDGRFLAIRSAAGDDVQVWSVDDSPPRLVLAESCHSTYGFGAVDFSPDGSLLAVGRPHGAVVVRSLPPADFHREWPVGSPACRVAFHPLQPQIAIVTMAAVEVRDYRSGRLLVRLENTAGASWVAWHPEGLLLATADASQSISLWQPPDFKRLRTLAGHDGGGTELRFNSSGTMLASHAWDNVLQFWDSSDGKLLFKCQTTSVPALHCARDRELWAGDVVAGRVQLWQADVNEVFRRLRSDFGSTAGELYMHLAVSPQRIGRSRLLAAAVGDSVHFWDLRSQREIGRLSVRTVMRVRFESSGALLTNSSAGILRWPILESGDAPGELIVGPADPVWPTGTNGDLAGTPDGRMIAFGGNSAAYVISADRPDSWRTLGDHADPRYVDISCDGRWVATGSHNGTNVNIWDAETGTLVRELPMGASHVAFSPDGTSLATTGDGLSLWSVSDWSRVWQGAGQNYSAPAFTADGRFIAVETGPGAIALYATPTGHEVARLADPYGRRQAWLAFSHDARFLAAIPYDFKGLALWNLGEVEDRLEKLGAGGERVSSPDRADDALENFPLTMTTRVEEPSRLQEKALVEVTQQIRQNPADPALHTRRGHILRKLNRLDEAIAEFTTAIEAGGNESLYQSRSYAHATANHYAQAIADAEKVLAAVNSDDAREAHACNQLAWYCLIGPIDTRQPERALALARRAHNRAPDLANYLNTLGVAHCRRAEWDDAIDALQRSLRAGSAAPAYDRYFLALAWHNLGKPGLASDSFDQAVYWHDTHGSLLDPISQRELSEIRQEVETQLSPGQSAVRDSHPAPGVHP